MTLSKLTKRSTSNGPSKATEAVKVLSKDFNKLIDELEGTSFAASTIGVNSITEKTSGSGVTITGQLVPTEVVTATNVLTAADSGKTMFLSAAAGFDTTLPAHASGLNFTFIVQVVPTSNDYGILAHADDQATIYGSAVCRDGNAGVAGATEDDVTFTTSSVIGDKVTFISDGTKWYAHAQTDVAAGITFNT